MEQEKITPRIRGRREEQVHLTKVHGAMKMKFLSKAFAPRKRKLWLSKFTTYLMSLGQFSTECHKTKTSNYSGQSQIKGRRAIHCPIKTHSNYTKWGRTCVSKSRLLLVLLVIGLESSASFLSQSQSVVIQSQSKCKLLLVLKWKPL